MRTLFLFAICSLVSTHAFCELADGSRYAGFVVTHSVDIPELEAHLTELTHEESGAEVVHIRLPDPENFFAIGFLAPPDSSKGTAHVLEHCVLEGSKKYPVPGLFHAMTSRTIASFMNAITTADSNFYPAASYDEEDFYNLLDVYLDAVFNPLLSPQMFKQERHVVYNEMKGALSSPHTRLMKAMAAELFRDSAYRFNSGGDPDKIATLTYDEFQDFHKKYYYPSNALFFFSGDIPLEKHLDFLASQNVLHGPKRTRPSIPQQPRDALTFRKDLLYPASPGTGDLTGFSWLTAPLQDTSDILALTVLDVILADTDASLLKSRLLQSGLCKEVYAFLNTSRSFSSYSILVEGARPEDADKIETLIYSSLEEIARIGIPEEVLQRAVERLLLATSEVSQLFGIALYQRIANLKLYGFKIEDALKIRSELTRLRAKGTKLYADLIYKYFLQDPHFVRLTFTASGDPAKQEYLSVDEDEEIAQIKTQDAVNLLPKCSLDSALRQARDPALSIETIGRLDLFHHECFTNHITYVDLMLSLPDIALQDLWLLQLFCDLAPQLGAASRSYQQNLEYIQEHTGGLSMGLAVLQEDRPALHVKTKGLDSKQKELFSLVYDVLTSADCTDTERIKELLLKYAMQAQNSIDRQALDFAIQTSLASASAEHRLKSYWASIDAIAKVVDLAAHIDRQMDDLVAKLQELQKRLLNAPKIDLIITCSKEGMENARKIGFGGFSDALSAADPWNQVLTDVSSVSCAYAINSAVAYTAQTFTTHDFTHPDSALIAMAAQLFKATVLHPRIREQGGAYGGGAKYSLHSGDFVFFSYRDPRIAKTAEVFKEAFEPLMRGEFSDEELEEARLQAAIGYSKQVAPALRGMIAYAHHLEGRSVAHAQVFQECLKKATREDIQRVVATHIAPKFNESLLITFAGQQLIDKEMELGILPMQVCKVL